jgi:hypothetical protein
MSTTQRADVYRRVHRGLRTALFDLVRTAGRTAWSDAREVAHLEKLFLEVFDFLRSHGEMEDTYHLPLLESKMPGITAHDTAEHREIEEAIEEVESAFAAALIADGDERGTFGERFFHRLNLFVGSYLGHMTHEETVTTAQFHEHCTDAEIIDASKRLVAALGPQRAASAMAFIVPAMDRDDRREYLAMVVASVDAAALPLVSGIVRNALSDGDWQDVRALLEPAMA